MLKNVPRTKEKAFLFLFFQEDVNVGVTRQVKLYLTIVWFLFLLVRPCD